MWNMIGTYNYIQYTNDTAWLSQNWAKYLKAMTYIYAKVTDHGLLHVTGVRDWARLTQGGNNSEANMMYDRKSTVNPLSSLTIESLDFIAH
jgi:hypothetical protein